MTFYFLHEGFYSGVELRRDQLKGACEELGINFVSLNSLTVNYLQLPNLSKPDLLYNAARGSEALESILLNKEVTTFYINTPDIAVSNLDTTKYSVIHDKSRLLSPKTIFHITADRDLLRRYVDHLGGFPIVVKAKGGSGGIGTIIAESWRSLFSVVDYLMTTGTKFILRQFIKAKSGSRMIVLGNKVVAGADFHMNENDFRNAADPSQVKYSARDYPEQANQLAINATHLANVEMAGVDLLEDGNGLFYLLEVNFPTGFSGLIDVCGVNIPRLMVMHLLDKSKRQ